MEQDEIEDYILDNEEWKQDKVICPYCKSESYNDDPEWLYQERDEEIECHKCGRTFHIESSYDWWFTTTPIDSEVKEILEEKKNEKNND